MFFNRPWLTADLCIGFWIRTFKNSGIIRTLKTIAYKAGEFLNVLFRNFKWIFPVFEKNNEKAWKTAFLNVLEKQLFTIVLIETDTLKGIFKSIFKIWWWWSSSNEKKILWWRDKWWSKHQLKILNVFIENFF